MKRKERNRKLRKLLKSEERKRQDLAEKHDRSEENGGTDLRRAEKPSAPPSDDLEMPPSKRPTPHSFLPDTDRDGFELPVGVTPQEAVELHLHGSPVEINFVYRGRSTTAIGREYSEAVNAYVGADKPAGNHEFGKSNLDGAMLIQDDKKEIFIESKCIENWSKSIYNPQYDVPFEHEATEEILDQSLKYARRYDRVDWYTNSLEFVRVYAKKFKAARIENFTFTVIPAARVKP